MYEKEITAFTNNGTLQSLTTPFSHMEVEVLEGQ
jgi:hypothetical protein